MTRAAAIFDLDGTLLPGTSAEWLFVRRAARARLLGPGAAVAGGWALFSAALRGARPLHLAAKAYLRGRACAPLEALGVAVVHDDVVPRLDPALLDLLESHRRQARAVVLLTGSLDFLAAEVARVLRCEAHAAARLERRDGRFTGRVLAPYPYAAGKVEALLDLARSLDVDLSRSHAYADRAADAAHLERVGFPCAVGADRGLRQLAHRRGWSVRAAGSSQEPAERDRPPR